MAFVHHQPRQHHRDRPPPQTCDSASVSFGIHQRQERDTPQDWSVVFPGRSRDVEPICASQHSVVFPAHSSNVAPAAAPAAAAPAAAAPAAASEEDGLDDTYQLALTLPPLHDGTGRFVASSLSPTGTEVAFQDADDEEEQEEQQQQQQQQELSEVFPEFVDSATESGVDVDDEFGFGFGSGSDFDTESDVVAGSSHPSRSSGRRGVARIGSTTWSLLNTSNALERVDYSVEASTQLYSSVTSSRAMDATSSMIDELQVVFTSGSESEHHNVSRGYDFYTAVKLDDAELAQSNLAQSAGLSHVEHHHLSVRRPKRRHRTSAHGRSSKRSNTSHSVLSIDCDSRLVNAHHAHHARHAVDGASTPRSATHASRMVPQHASKTSRVIGSILRRVFDLEPEVLDAFLHDDAERHRSAAHQHSHVAAPTTAARVGVGFGFEAAESAIVCAPLCDATSEHEPWPALSHTQTLVADAANELSTSPLFSNAKPVAGEQTRDTSAWRLTEAALLQRGSASTRPRACQLMEPTTMEAFSAFVNTMVMPVPIPLRLLGALFGWSSMWSASRSTKMHNPDDHHHHHHHHERMARDADEERKYRYERLLSTQQAKAWSRRYRGILFANVDDEQPSPDVPELWRGEEHPAIAAGEHD